MLVNDMLAEVRAISDENNTTDVSDTDILSALNRAQQKLARIAAKRYSPLFMREIVLSSFSGREVTLPESALSLTINQVDVREGDNYYRINIAPMTAMTDLENSSSTSRPQFYSLRGNKLLVYPTPATGVQLRVRYQIRPDKLVTSQGRITSFDSPNFYIYVDSLGSDLTTSIAELKAFVNVVDSTTGLIKGTMQINSIDTTQKRLTIKTASLNRTTVFGHAVDSIIPTDIEYDDYVCIADGTCIPTLTRDYSDFLIQHAVVEILNRLGIPSQEAYGKLKELEQDVNEMWSGRPERIQIRQANRHWLRRP
jgi:hypothetical protein